jgi:hypothetical protein
MGVRAGERPTAGRDGDGAAIPEQGRAGRGSEDSNRLGTSRSTAGSLAALAKRPSSTPTASPAGSSARAPTVSDAAAAPNSTPLTASTRRTTWPWLSPRRTARW